MPAIIPAAAIGALGAAKGAAGAAGFFSSIGGLGTALSGIGSIASAFGGGGGLNRKELRDAGRWQNKLEIERLQGLKEFGIHPLAALGSPGYSVPAVPVSPGRDYGAGLRAIGSQISAKEQHAIDQARYEREASRQEALSKAQADFYKASAINELASAMDKGKPKTLEEAILDATRQWRMPDGSVVRGPHEDLFDIEQLASYLYLMGKGGVEGMGNTARGLAEGLEEFLENNPGKISP